MIKVKNLKMLDALKNHEDQEIAYVEDEDKFYIFDEGWIDYEVPKTEGMQLSLYEINKMAVAQLSELSEEDLNNCKTTIKDYAKDGVYWMLLSNEYKYYTVFMKGNNSAPNIEDEAIECLKELGSVRSIEMNEDNILEAWVVIEDVPYVFYLFNYDKGVILCK